MDDSEKDKDHDETLKFLIWSRGFDLAGKAFSTILYLGIGYYIWQIFKELAGKTTITDIVLKYIISEDGYNGVPWLLVVIFGLWAGLERSLRKRKTKYFQGRVTELEKRLDPNRTTSGLLETGDTHPKDRIK